MSLMVKHEKLQCNVRSLRYDFETRKGTLFLPEHNAADMHGCIEVFKAIDTDVRKIYVRFDTGVTDVIYEQVDDDLWVVT